MVCNRQQEMYFLLPIFYVAGLMDFITREKEKLLPSIFQPT